MKLIVTLGTTKAKYLNKYIIGEIEYNENFSFLALKKHFNINDENVIIIGTKETFIEQKEYIKEYKFIEVDADKFEDIFAKSLSIMDNDSILDLTQSLKSLGYGALLSYSFSKSIGKKVKNIYYAQIQDRCNIFEKTCVFIFQSLKKYEDIIDLAREINMFINSWFVLNQKKEKEFKLIHNNLVKLSQKLFINNLNVLGEIKIIEDEIDKLLKLKEYDYLHSHLEVLQKEINIIKNPLMKKEYLKMIEFSRLYFDKNFLLQSLTTLFEAVSSFVDYKTKKGFECKRNNKIFKKYGNKYKFRNCLKSKLSVVRYNRSIPDYLYRFINIENLEKFAKHFMIVDELRNNSAHVFINNRNNSSNKKKSSFKQKIKNELEFFENIIKDKK